MTTYQQKGFTLVELLVAIAIIGILATIALVTLNDARRKGRDVTRVAEMHQLQVALAIYYDDNGGYPGGGGVCGALPSGLVPSYVNALPTDPGGGSLAYAYGAASASTTQDYVLRADLENTGHSALDTDVDGASVLNCDCADTNGYFCVQP